MTGNENHVDKFLPGGGGGVGSLGGGSGDGVSLNLNWFKNFVFKKKSVTLHASKKQNTEIMYIADGGVVSCIGGLCSTHLFLAASPVWAGRPGEADNGGYDFQR